MKKTLNKDVKFQFRLNEAVRELFKDACKFNGVDASEDLRKYMKQQIKKYLKERDIMINDIKNKLDDLAAKYSCEFIWDGGADGHYYSEKNGHLNDDQYNKMRSELDNISEELRGMIDKGIIDDESELWGA